MAEFATGPSPSPSDRVHKPPGQEDDDGQEEQAVDDELAMADELADVHRQARKNRSTND